MREIKYKGLVDVLEGLKADATNGESRLCLITEEVLEAIKEVARIEKEEHKKEKEKSFNEGYRHGEEDEVVTKDLEEEARILREQYLEIEEKLKELGRTTKRVQTFVSKLKDNK